jgi:hypothetical protein
MTRWRTKLAAEGGVAVDRAGIAALGPITSVQLAPLLKVFVRELWKSRAPILRAPD